MRATLALFLLTAGVLLGSALLVAQSPEDMLHTADGNAREMFASIIIPPLANAPFVATVHAEWTHQLPDSTTITVKNHRVVMRDSKGRIYQERRQLTPDGDQRESQLTQIEISDSVQHIKYFCNPYNHVCVLRSYFMPVTTPTMPVGPVGQGAGYLSREDLGKSQVSGLEVVGTRETTTVNAGTMGNDGAVTVTKEFWYSPQLDLNLAVKRIDPVHGTQVIAVGPISLTEPDARMFSLPAGYRVVDERPASQVKQGQSGR